MKNTTTNTVANTTSDAALQPNKVTLERLRQLIQASLASRDDLNAAARALDDEELAELCRRLATDHEQHAAELQRYLLAAGEEFEQPDLLESRLQADLVALLKEKCGDNAVLEDAQACEETLKNHYDVAAKEANVPVLGKIFERHREEVEFGEQLIEVVREAEGDIS